MTTLRVDDRVWDIIPDLTLLVIGYHDFNNSGTVPPTVLSSAASEAAMFLTQPVFSENPVVAEWREIYRRFRTKKGVRSSIESLLKRVSNGQSLPRINPLVDIYNAMSVKYGIPCGAEDLHAVEGDIVLSFAVGGESFRALGDDIDSPALEGELCYIDQVGVLCRCLNWRESSRTSISDTTRDAVIVVEALGSSEDRARAAIRELCGLLQEHAGGRLTYGEASRVSPVVGLD